MSNFKLTEKSDITEISLLATECFVNDPFYKQIDENSQIRKEKIQQIFTKSIPICIKYGQVYCVKEKDNLIGFSLWFDYHKLKQYSIEDFNHMFNINDIQKDSFPNEFSHIDNYLNESSYYFYLLAIAVKEEYRKQGWATQMITLMQKTYPAYNLFSDLSNVNSITIYQRLGFELIEQYDNIALIRYLAKQ